MSLILHTPPAGAEGIAEPAAQGHAGNLGLLFATHAHEERTAIIDLHDPAAPRDVSFRELDDLCNAVARGLMRAGLKAGELHLFDGSPPCQAFSTAGTRDKGWGKDKKYAHGAEQKNEELFSEFVRLRDGLRPRAFVAENVSGLVKGKAKGFFLEILRELKRGYRVEARLLDAQWLGVPQQRVRVIFVGVRDDLGLDPAFPDPLPYRYSVRDALPWIGGAHHDSGGKFASGGNITDKPSPTLTIGHANYTHFGVQGRVLHDTGRKGQKAKDITDLPAPTITSGPDDVREGGGPRNHFKVEAETDISRFAIGAEYDKLNPGQQSEKYFSLVRPALDEPCPTMTYGQLKGSLSGASVVHPTEKRRFSILEVKRLCGFPDDFELKGSFAAQWERLGNSVPPPMAAWIGATIRDKILLPCREKQQQNGSGRKSTSAGQTSAGRGKHAATNMAMASSMSPASAAAATVVRTSSRLRKNSVAD